MCKIFYLGVNLNDLKLLNLSAVIVTVPHNLFRNVNYYINIITKLTVVQWELNQNVL